MNKPITYINGTEIVVVEENGNVYVPIKPICAVLGIADNKQREKILEDEILGSVGTLRVSTGADGKQYEMFCLPLKYIYGWLFSINPKNVAPEAKEVVSRYRRECYEALYDHFHEAMQRTIETNEQEIKLLEKISNYKDAESDARRDRKGAEEALAKLRRERLNPQPRLFEGV